MRTTIDKAGRLVVPKALRDRLGLHAGTQVDMTIVEGHLEAHPIGPSVVVETRDGRPVFTTTEPVEPLTDEQMYRLIDDSRQWPHRS